MESDQTLGRYETCWRLRTGKIVRNGHPDFTLIHAAALARDVLETGLVTDAWIERDGIRLERI